MLTTTHLAYKKHNADSKADEKPTSSATWNQTENWRRRI